MNDTDSCPINIPGYTHHGNCDLLCAPATWSDILMFFVGNYIAHAATVISLPGQSLSATILSISMALLFPSQGVLRAIQTIAMWAQFAPTELQKAARAGALCVVVDVARLERGTAERRGVIRKRIGVSPIALRLIQNMEKVFNKPKRSTVTEQEDELAHLRPQSELRPIVAERVHGIQRLPQGYKLVVLSPKAKFLADPVVHADLIAGLFKIPERPSTKLASSYSALKLLISLGQLLFGIATLYRVRGDQVQRFGFTAFGLTVAPYAWMSFLNLLGNLVSPQYPTKFLVSSKTLDELRERIANQDGAAEFPIEGTVGRITPETDDAVHEGQAHPMANPSFFEVYISYVAAFIISAVPIIIIGAISRFERGSSALYQQVWTMMWLACGIIVAPAVYVIEHVSGFAGIRYESILLATMLYSVPAIGGFVVVGEMISQYGVCSESL